MEQHSHRDIWIEQYFYGNPNFGKKSCLEIPRNGPGIDQVVFTFVLPELPNGLTYKKLCIYDLIRSIEIQIDGRQFLKLYSKNLESFDKVERNFQIIENYCMLSDNNTISYPFDLKYFFGESTSSDNFDSILPLDFKGIRLIDCHQSLRFILTLNEIYSLIDASDAVINLFRDSLSKLNLIDVGANGHFVKVCQKNYYNMENNDTIS